MVFYGGNSVLIHAESESIVIDVSDSRQRKLALRWLQLGVLALALAGLFALLLVASRVPGSERFFPWIDFFRTALVVHVDQSVLIWFLAMSGVAWCLTSVVDTWRLLLQRIAYYSALGGALGIALSAFIGDGAPLMNNYVPVLQRSEFFVMLGLFGFGIVLQAFTRLSAVGSIGIQRSAVHIPSLVAWTLSLTVMISVLALLLAWLQMPAEVDGHAYYEYLFWGAGHTLQFAYTQLVILAWLLLAVNSGATLPGNAHWYAWILILGVVPVLSTPLIYLFYDTVSLASKDAFTAQMKYGGGLAVIPAGVLVVLGLLRSRSVATLSKPLRSSLWMSLLLFFSGGAIALFISGVNTIIPAHYHGSIVGVTIGLMGMAYLVLPKLGYPAPQGRMVEMQPWIYGIGQLLHILGLAASGAMGIQRKTAGAAQGLDSLSAKVAMGVMGIGGLLAVIGGILFVWVMIRTFMRAK